MILLHNHTAIGSNTRGFLDSINKVEDMVQYAKELGHTGIAITDHDATTAHIDLLHYINKLRKEDSETWNDFKPICGNEIYLCSKQNILENKDYSKLYHFILLAKDDIGHRQIRELSTRAWCDNFFTYVIPRTPTYFEDLLEVIGEDPGHLIGLTACLGGQLDRMILEAYNGDGDYSLVKKWLNTMRNKFGEGNFFLEMQPSLQEDQLIVNKVILDLSKELNIPYVITTDSHYLKKEDREIHKAFLNSEEENGSREVDEFYSTTYMMSEKEIHEYMDEYLGYDAVQLGLDNSEVINGMCKEYTLDNPLKIPYKAFDTEEPSYELYLKYVNNVPLLKYFYESKHDCDRHMCREILKKFEERPEEFQNQETYDALHDCLDAIITSSEAQNTQWSGYLMVCRELINTVWESGSLCGAGRGSGVGFFLLYMLDITQINPLREDTPTFYWRFLHSKRASVLDIDFDSQGSKKDLIIENLRKKYGGYRHVTKVQTISTAKSKRALQIAARSLGYTAEEGVYIGSFIKADRGMLRTLSQTFYGDPENDIEPDREFANLMTHKYPDVWKIALRIEGLPTGIGSHAGGVILSTDDLSERCALMRTRSGDIITQVDLHRAEENGLIKYDLLNIDALEKIHAAMDLLIEDGLMEWQGDLKSTYEKYLGVYNIERKDPKIWDLIDEHKILSLFQFEREAGWNCIEKGQPRSLPELTALNSVMRLMTQEGETETPMDIYSRHRKDITTWYKEMDEYGVSKSDQEIVKKYALQTYGLLPNQENFMQIVQDPAVGGFDLLWSDKLRKSIAKKNPKEFEVLQQEFYDNIKEKNLSEKLCRYVWDKLICMSKGYGFNSSHTLAYSIIGLQEANLAYKYPMVYWNCANLISDSGGQDGTVNYGKNASAISRMIKEGINIVPPYINETRFGFKPDAKNNKIVFGLKALIGIGAEQANGIVANQPYTSMEDFYEKMENYKTVKEGFTFGDAAMITLIKAGAFDDLEKEPREKVMERFIRKISKPLKSLTMSNIEDLAKLNMLTDDQKQYELRLYRFKKYVYKPENLIKKAGKSPATYFYRLEPKYALPYFKDMFEGKDTMEEDKDYYIKNDTKDYVVKRGSLDKTIEKLCEDFTNTTLNNPDNLQKINDTRYLTVMEDRALGNISQWEMESMVYYYHEHELANVDTDKYNIVDFYSLPTETEISTNTIYRGQVRPRYVLHRICGTVLDTDKNRHIVTLLTPTGVVSVKFFKGTFNYYMRTIAEFNEDGTKNVLENSWFKRGTKLMVTGYRSDENFYPRVYNDSFYKHTVQKIESVRPNGELELKMERIDADYQDLNAERI